MPNLTGAHHAALTVTDVERSVAWYQDVLGMSPVFGDSNDEVTFTLMAHPSGWFLGLREYHGKAKDRFDEFRCGLDHFAFGVPDRAELDSWVAVLDAKGVTYSPVVETPIGSVVTFRDPDNIQLELWLDVS
jgi:glyoxylase I family protein